METDKAQRNGAARPPKKIRSAMATTVEELVYFLQAAHVSQDTDWDLEARGGVILDAYPEQLKTTLVHRAYRYYPEVRMLSDINAREMQNLREALITARYQSMAFLDYQKVWERDERTSANTEGVIRALCDEGWQGHANMHGAMARSFIIMCITPHLWELRKDTWERNGFRRRFLHIQYVFEERALLETAIVEGHSFRLKPQQPIMRPLMGKIPYRVQKNESDYIKHALQTQRYLIPLQMVLRVYNTLKWHFDECVGEKDRGMQVLMNVAPLLGEHPGKLVLERKADLQLVPAPPEETVYGADITEKQFVDSLPEKPEDDSKRSRKGKKTA
jgi:hypothetical protein